MNSKFVPAEFIRDIGCDLVREFGNARKATTPSLVGSAMENPVRERLRQVLPRGIDVGSGCILDSYGNVSRQMDVVLYETGICPVFRVNETPEATYYPIEGVLAVGEIKSRIGNKELRDSFAKIKSVKSLRRNFQYDEVRKLWVGRRYCEHGSIVASGFDMENTNMGDVFGFILSEESTMSVLRSKNRSLVSLCKENIEDVGYDFLCPDMVVLLNGNVLKRKMIQDIPEGNDYLPTRSQPTLYHSIFPYKTVSPFGFLLTEISRWMNDGLTAHIPMEGYLKHELDVGVQDEWAIMVHVEREKALKYPNFISRDAFNTPMEHLNNRLTLLEKSGE